jgi:hypothetical protein
MSDSYVRPQYTMQDKITEEEIEIMLEDYVEVEDINSVPRGTHIRYYTVLITDGRAKKVFRIGGELKFVSEDKVYIMLVNGDSKWSVQTKNSIFYRQLSICEIKDEYEQVLDEYESEILELKKINRKLYKKLTGKSTAMVTDTAPLVAPIEKSKKTMKSARKSNTMPKSKSEYDTDKNFRL